MYRFFEWIASFFLDWPEENYEENVGEDVRPHQIKNGGLNE